MFDYNCGLGTYPFAIPKPKPNTHFLASFVILKNFVPLESSSVDKGLRIRNSKISIYFFMYTIYNTGKI